MCVCVYVCVYVYVCVCVCLEKFVTVFPFTGFPLCLSLTLALCRAHTLGYQYAKKEDRASLGESAVRDGEETD